VNKKIGQLKVNPPNIVTQQADFSPSCQSQAELAGEPLRTKKKNPNTWTTKRQKEDWEKDGAVEVGSKDSWDEIPEQPKASLHPAAKRLERKQAKEAEDKAEATDVDKPAPVVTLLCGGLPFDVTSEVRSSPRLQRPRACTDTQHC
jgi:hypothetical protein